MRDAARERDHLHVRDGAHQREKEAVTAQECAARARDRFSWSSIRSRPSGREEEAILIVDHVLERRAAVVGLRISDGVWVDSMSDWRAASVNGSRRATTSSTLSAMAISARVNAWTPASALGGRRSGKDGRAVPSRCHRHARDLQRARRLHRPAARRRPAMQPMVRSASVRSVDHAAPSIDIAGISFALRATLNTSAAPAISA